jgi:hypothetical protein
MIPRVVKVPGHRRDGISWAGVKARSPVGRFLSTQQRDTTIIYDLTAIDNPPMRLSGAWDHMLAGSCLVCCDQDGFLHRYEVSGAGWNHVRQIGWVPLPNNTLPHGSRLQLSESGRYLVVWNPVLNTASERGIDVLALLLDAASGRVIRTLDQWDDDWRAFAFVRLPSGREAIFYSSHSWARIGLIDCSSGETLFEYEQASPNEFCHTDFALTSDGRRLLTVGCFWMGPFEIRCYDAAPWTLGTPAEVGFPLPLIFCQSEEVFDDQDSLAGFRKEAEPDGIYWCVHLLKTEGLPGEGSVEFKGLLDDLSEPNDRALLMRSVRLPHSEGALIVRRFDLQTGGLVGSTLVPVPIVRPARIHPASRHRVLVAGGHLLDVNGFSGTVSDAGPTGLPADGYGGFDNGVTRDGETLIIWDNSAS